MINESFFSDWELNSGVTVPATEKSSATLDFVFPSDYLNFMRRHNGGAGFLGESYLILWKLEELPSLNDEYEVKKYAPGLVLFGSSGGGEAYGFDRRGPVLKIVGIPFAGMDFDYLRIMGSTFEEFLLARKRDNDE